MMIRNFKAFRINRKLSRRQLAELVGVSQQFIQQVESGQKSPSLDTAVRLASALGCTLDELVAETEEQKHV